MSDLINSGVMQGLVGAFSSVRLASVSMGVYEQAKTQGNEDTAQRALGYATDSMTEAQKFSADAKDALLEAKETAKEEEKQAQQADLERSAESAAGQAPQTPAPSESQTSEIHLTHGTDRLEISEQGREAAGEAALSTETPAPTPTASGEKRPASEPAPQTHNPAETAARHGKQKAPSKPKARFTARA